MKVNPKLRLQILIQNSFFVVLFIALIFLLGFVANQYKFAKDITQANRNTLTTGSINVLEANARTNNINCLRFGR